MPLVEANAHLKILSELSNVPNSKVTIHTTDDKKLVINTGRHICTLSE